MIAVDTNVLVYAHRSDCERHDRALEWIRTLAEGIVPWAIPVFCVGEFIRVVTHRKVFSPPSTLEEAFAAIDSLFASPSIRLLYPAGSFVPLFQTAATESGATGNIAFDAQIAALCREHGVRDLLTDDRDFARFSTIRPVPLDANPESI